MKIVFTIDTGDDNINTEEIISFVTKELSPRIQYLIEEDVSGMTGNGSPYIGHYSWSVKCDPSFAKLKSMNKKKK